MTVCHAAKKKPAHVTCRQLCNLLGKNAVHMSVSHYTLLGVNSLRVEYVPLIQIHQPFPEICVFKVHLNIYFSTLQH